MSGHTTPNLDLAPQPCLCDSSPMCKKCCSVFANHYTLDDDLECPLDYELSLLPNAFPYDIVIYSVFIRGTNG